MGRYGDYADDRLPKAQRAMADDVTWGMTRDIATWAEKVALLEERCRELSAEVARLSNELARRSE